MTRNVGGCESAENPRLDARHANPLWAIDMDDWLHVRAARRQPQPPDQRFSLWRVIGRKSLTQTGSDLRLTVQYGEHGLHVALDDSIVEGMAFFSAVPLEDALRNRLTQFLAEARLLDGAKPQPRARPTSRAALLHLRALQAIDGVRDGASHRDIAAVLVGVDTARDRWSADSELRAQVRYLVARAEGLMRGGYRALAGLRPQGDERLP